MAQALVEGANRRYIRTASLNLSQIVKSFRPSGGELFVFKQPDILKKGNWKADGHL